MRKIIIIIKKIYRRFEMYVLWPLCLKNGKLSAIYYLLFSNKFDLECRSVLAGKIEYNKQNSIGGVNTYNLRRNIHRLEKGLVMRPRKPVFALDYINQTVNDLIKLKGELNNDQNDLLKWGKDVASEYFNQVNIETNSGLERTYQLFVRHFKESVDIQFKPSVVKKNLSTISFEDFLRLAQQRRSVRLFLDKSVDRELILKSVDAASMSPSACNRQPFHLRIIDQKELMDKISNITFGVNGFSQNIPALGVLVGELNAFYSEQDKHIIYIDGALFAMSLMYSLETVGLSSCPINWPDLYSQNRNIKRILNLSLSERPIMLLAIGYADKSGFVPYSQKKSSLELVKFNNDF